MLVKRYVQYVWLKKINHTRIVNDAWTIKNLETTARRKEQFNHKSRSKSWSGVTDLVRMYCTFCSALHTEKNILIDRYLLFPFISSKSPSNHAETKDVTKCFTKNCVTFECRSQPTFAFYIAFHEKKRKNCENVAKVQKQTCSRKL